jgi:hypothetical protein
LTDEATAKTKFEYVVAPLTITSGDVGEIVTEYELELLVIVKTLPER